MHNNNSDDNCGTLKEAAANYNEFQAVEEKGHYESDDEEHAKDSSEEKETDTEDDEYEGFVSIQDKSAITKSWIILGSQSMFNVFFLTKGY